MRSLPIPQTEPHHFSEQGYGRLGFVRPSHDASRRSGPLKQTRPSVDTGAWRLVVEKSARPLLAERDERLPRLAQGHTSPD